MLKIFTLNNLNIFFVPRINTNTGSRAFSISHTALWNAMSVPKVAHVDEPALASIMTHDHAENLCTSEHI